MFFGKEVRIILRGQGREAYLELKKRADKEAQSIINSFERGELPSPNIAMLRLGLLASRINYYLSQQSRIPKLVLV